MKSLRQQRDFLSKLALTVTGVVAALLLSLDPFVADHTELQKPVAVARYVVLFATIILALSRWLYDTFIWRLLSPRLDLNGRWSYVHHYSPPVALADGVAPMRQNTGWLEIRQTPNSIQYLGARETMNGTAVSSSVDDHAIDFASIAFDIADSGVGVMLYEVRRKPTHRCLAELRAETVRDGSAPRKIFVRFHSLEPSPTYMGEGTYIFKSPSNRVADKLVEAYRRFFGTGR